MKKAVLTVCSAAMATALCFVAGTRADEHDPAAEPEEVLITSVIEIKPLIQMAILLDTSSSMSGLIDQARTELWAIVNEFIFAKRNGKEPELQVALYEYGKSSLSGQEGYIRMILPLTADLDKVSEELFALTTNGGSEYCGWVIKEAVESLHWNDSPDELKVIFIAGNEPFTQGPLDYRQSCKAAASKGIIVNTIHCGSEGAGLEGKWKDGALLADGRYLNIDQNRKTIHIEAPQDSEIAELGIRLNDTYIAYGKAGKMSAQRQAAQDNNAAAASETAGMDRALTKSSPYYRNDAWDLVDALESDKVKLEDMKAEDLPENMQRMSAEERKAYIESMATERAQIQQRIQQLSDQRKKHVAAEMKKHQENGDTLGSAVTQLVREQAKQRNFKFESGTEPSKN
jgi:hypothetical protein